MLKSFLSSVNGRGDDQTNHSLHSSGKPVVRVVYISIGNGTFRGAVSEKPLNRST